MAGRDQREPMERLTRVLAVLTSAGSSGVPVDHLVDIAGFTSADAEARRDQLKREIRHLTQQGWEITNIADEGAPAIYRLATVDNRLRIKLTPGQAAELQRAVLFASRADLVDRLGLLQGALDEDLPAEVTTAGADQTLDLVVEAVRMSCLLRFRYGGTDRAVHPQTVRTTGAAGICWLTRSAAIRSRPSWCRGCRECRRTSPELPRSTLWSGTVDCTL